MATTKGTKGENIQRLMITASKVRFGYVNRLPYGIEWLSDNRPHAVLACCFVC